MKRVFILLLSVIMVLSVGCGSAKRKEYIEKAKAFDDQ